MIFKNRDQDGLNMVWVITTVIIVSMFLVISSFIVFLNSGAYDTVKQISAANKSLEVDDLSSYDTRSAVEPDDIQEYANLINGKIININDDNSFSNEQISEEQLGY